MSLRHNGFVALVGRPNTGKSTLLNALVGRKVSIVTPRPQTTRHRVLGIVNEPDAQIAFVDTPGLHSGPRRALNQAMNRTAATVLADTDVAVMVVEALRWTAEDGRALERVRAAGPPLVAAVNKIDRVKPRNRLLPFIAELGARADFRAIVPVSAQTGENLPEFVRTLTALLPEGPDQFPVDQVTDRDERFRIGEVIREKLTLELVEELPYGIAVEIESLTPLEDGRTEVGAVIWVDREGQKPIVIGAGGERLKRVGRSARTELNRLLNRRFHLTLWVKVRENWADDARALAQLGVE